MPEEKKEKFTFSDKIKNSKPAGNKSFAKSSAKIGRDGKPKATLFERTRRDAPFFIAALIALLLLPFLYKYSGQVDEEAFLTDSSQAEFDPERYGFDTAMIEDPDGQIAQLSGRDSLSLIKGFGSNEEEDYGRDDLDLDASSASDYEGSAEGEYAATRASSTNIDEENNTTNIYKRRAGRATRAAFRRTKIGTLNNANMRRPGGSRLGVNNWGGGLKEAARKVGPSAPKEAPKPVSLQPLRAVNPARSSFGNGSATAARRSKDNMGKFNPREALRDSYVKPVDPSRVGGLDAFSMGPGGGAGSLNHSMNIAPGREPWWWDMMKTRMQKEWEKRFERKWKWIDWMDDLARNILGGILNCLITGDDGGDMGHMFGYGAGGGGRDATCCGVSESKAASKAEIQEAGSFEAWCKIKTNQAKLKALGYNCSISFKPGTPKGESAGFFGARLKCLGIGGGAYVSGSLGLRSSSGMECDSMPNYNVIPSGEARKWNIYTYVVARNYFPDSLKAKFPDLVIKDGKRVNLLCSSMDRRHGGTSLNHNDPTGGVGHVDDNKTFARDLIIEHAKASGNTPQEQQRIRERTLEVDQESLGDACVIMVSRGNVLPYEAMKNQIMDLFKKLGRGISEKDAEQAFYELDLMYVSSIATKHKLAFAAWGETGHRLERLLPMPYWEFENAYIQHRKVTHKKNGSNDNVYKKKWRVEDVDMVRGVPCFYDNLFFECDPNEGNTATLHFDKVSFKGGRTEEGNRVTPTTNDVQVSAEFRYFDNPHGNDTVIQTMIQPDTTLDNGFTFKYTFDRIYDSNKVKRTGEAVPYVTDKGGLVGNVIWRAKRGKQEIEKVCPLNLAGDGVSPIVPEKPRQITPPAPKPEDPKPDPKPEDPKPETPKAKTHLAPQLTWVPCDAKDRKPITAGKTMEKKDFGTEKGCYVLAGTDREHCAGSTLEMDSNAAKKFVLDVIAAYNATNPPVEMSKQLVGEHGFPTDGEFLDALNIASKLGISKVPAAAVCEFGRDMVRMSQDKHTGDMRMAQPAETPYGSGKEINSLFHNELGAFLAYVHPQAIFYPQMWTGNGKQCDYRFLVFSHTDRDAKDPREKVCPSMVNWANQHCTYSHGQRCKEYHFVNYNAVPPSLTIAYSAFMNSLTATQKQAPLAGLSKNDLPSVGTGAKGGYKNGPGQKYIENITSMLREAPGFSAWQGNACTTYANGLADLNVADVLIYVRGNGGKGGVCNDGLDYKPHGAPGNPNQNRPSNASAGTNPTGQGS